MTSADLLTWLVEATFATTAVLLLILFLRNPLRQRFGAAVPYALWTLMPAAVLAVSLPGPTTAVMREVTARSVSTSAPHVSAGAAVTYPDTAVWLCAVWLLGASMAMFRLAMQQRRFKRGLGRLRRIEGGLWQAEGAAGLPAALGLLRPTIVVPPDFDTRYTAEQRHLMRAHESMHIACGDLYFNAVAALFRSVFWFNPLLHFAAGYFRHDQEMACDQRVMARNPQSQRAYGEAMFKTQLAAQPLPLGCHWLAFNGDGSHPLQERIAMLKQPVPSFARLMSGAALVASLTLAAGFTAWAAQPKTLAFQGIPVPAGEIKTQLSIGIDGDKSQVVTVINPAGKPFSMRTGDDGHIWEIEGWATPLAKSAIEYYFTFRKDGEVVATPRGIATSGKAVTMSVGKLDEQGAFKGYELNVVLTAGSSDSPDQAENPTPFHAALLRYAARLGLTIENPEMLSERTGAQNYFFDDRIPAGQLLQRLAKEDGLDVEIRGKQVRFNQTSDNGRAADMRDASVVQRNPMPEPPVYPPQALQQKMAGKVILIVDVAADGRPTALQVEKSEPVGVFDAAAREAAMKWIFQPAIVDGKPVAGRVRVPIQFDPNGEPSEG